MKKNLLDEKKIAMILNKIFTQFPTKYHFFIHFFQNVFSKIFRIFLTQELLKITLEKLFSISFMNTI